MESSASRAVLNVSKVHFPLLFMSHYREKIVIISPIMAIIVCLESRLDVLTISSFPLPILYDNRRRTTRTSNESNGRNFESIRIGICRKANVQKKTTSQNSK